MISPEEKHTIIQDPNKKYERYFKHSPIGIAILDENGCFIEPNAAFINHIHQ